LGVVLPALLVYVLGCFWRRSREQMLASFSGGMFTVAVASLICGWWVRGTWRTVLAYPTQFGKQGVLAKTELTDALLEWWHFPKAALARNLLLICILTWPFAAALFGSERRLRTFNWAALWAGVCPLLVLSKMGTTFQPYGAVALLGAYVVLLFPFSGLSEPLVQRGGFAALLAFACALSIWSFFSEMRSTHDVSSNNKRGTVAALRLMRDHAMQNGRKRVTLGLVHWATLHDASLVDALLFDVGVRVGAPSYRPKRRRGAPLIVDPMVLDPWAWDPDVRGTAAITPDAWVNQLKAEADYVLVLAGGRYQDRRQGRWIPWIDASEQLRHTPEFQRLGSVFMVNPEGPVELLVRRPFPHD
jgi:hypothetical protein